MWRTRARCGRDACKASSAVALPVPYRPFPALAIHGRIYHEGTATAGSHQQANKQSVALDSKTSCALAALPPAIQPPALHVLYLQLLPLFVALHSAATMRAAVTQISLMHCRVGASFGTFPQILEILRECLG